MPPLPMHSHARRLRTAKLPATFFAFSLPLPWS
ncbi:MAG: hypothetical protein AW10_03048 [Candidatus Accumulibacter appositus]|uniref:Uncharacterized protein n=1 Tax=Candidatus Accumulibacter appositus TaxID=1454003 RepID=A0A011NSX6_9PROT|nr:MAG: hypothetical protein AW10_03048 [Candidatus Accumulibacter appositus]